MTNLTQVSVNNGIPTGGTGTVSTIDALMADGGQATLGAKADAAASTTDTTPISAISIFKQISKSIQLMVFGAGTAAAAQRTTLASDDPAVATLGATNGAAVITDATGTLQQYLRGLVKLWVGGLAASESVIGKTAGIVITPTANFTRPANTTVYVSGYLVANSTTAGSVVPLSWTAARVAAGNFMVRRARIKKSGTGVTNANFRVHLYGTDPSAASGISNGDGAAWLTKEASYLGALDVTVDKAFSDAARGSGVPTIGSEISVVLASGQTVYGLVEARNAYTPISAEVITVELELIQN